METNCYCCKKIVYVCDYCNRMVGHSLKNEGKFCSKKCEMKKEKKILTKKSIIFCSYFCENKISLLAYFEKDFFKYNFKKDVLNNYGTNSYYFKKNYNTFRFSDHFSKHKILTTFFDFKHQDFSFKICEVSLILKNYDENGDFFVSQDRFDFVIPGLTSDNIETKILEIKDLFKKENLIINN